MGHPQCLSVHPQGVAALEAWPKAWARCLSVSPGRSPHRRSLLLRPRLFREKPPIAQTHLSPAGFDALGIVYS